MQLRKGTRQVVHFFCNCASDSNFIFWSLNSGERRVKRSVHEAKFYFDGSGIITFFHSSTAKPQVWTQEVGHLSKFSFNCSMR